MEYAEFFRDVSEVADATNSPQYSLIKSLFDEKEYERVLHMVEYSKCSDVDILSLCLLSEIFLLEKTSHKSSDSLLKNAEDVYSRFSNDGIINFLYAKLLLRAGGVFEFGLEVLLKSIRLCSWNWEAWLELSRIVDDDSAVQIYQQYECYKFYMYERMMYRGEYKELSFRLLSEHRGWCFKEELLGKCYHEMREFEKAVNVFASLAKNHPFRISGMDVYSNCLFVLERSETLSQLAHHWMRVNPNSFETSVIAGNYFSLKSQHEKAATFFKRAVTFNPHSVNALILLGHELVELRNPSAALAVYQQAACKNTTSNRGWHAMGQLFELINQHAFAVYYYEKAAKNDPSDSRIYKALASCYTKLNRSEQANACLQKIKLSTNKE